MKQCSVFGLVAALLVAFNGASPAASLANISTRTYVEPNTWAAATSVIGGFIITGDAPKTVLLRAVSSIPLPDVIGDPQIILRDSAQQPIASNTDWQTAPNAAEIAATGLAPSSSYDAAILISLPPGAYTTIVAPEFGTLHGGIVPGPGVGMVEIYDLDLQSASRLANISTRGEVYHGTDHAMIGGFIVVGETAQRIIVRAIGPSLPLEGKLADPTLELYDANGQSFAVDDNWRTGGQEAEIVATGLAPTDDLESAVVSTVAPGSYTAIVKGVDDSIGIALVEVYALTE